MTIGERITQKRKELGLSQEELGNKLNVSRQAVHKWESDNGLPDVDNIIALCKLFDVSLDWLLKGIEPEGGTSVAENVAEIPERIIIKEVPKKRSRLLAFLIAAIIVFLIMCGVRLKKIENNYQQLQNQLSRMQVNTDRSIGSISQIIQNTLDKYNSAVLDKSVEIAGFDIQNNTVSFSAVIMPKNISKDMKVRLDIIAEDGSGREYTESVYAEPVDEKRFSVQFDCPITDNIAVMCAFIRGNESENALLANYYNLYSMSFDNYSIIAPFDFCVNSERTAFEDEYCLLDRWDYENGTPKADTASISVALFDSNDSKICEYKRLDESPFQSSDERMIVFARPMDTKLDPDMTYYEKLTVTDIYGRTFVYFGH